MCIKIKTDMSKQYKTDELIELTLKAVKKHKLVFITDVVIYLPVSRTTFYNHNLDKVDSIKEAILDNQVSMKMKLRSKWMESQAPVLQLALMKLISSDDERRALSTSFMETKQKHQVEDMSPFTDEQLIEMMKDQDTNQGGEDDSTT